MPLILTTFINTSRVVYIAGFLPTIHQDRIFKTTRVKRTNPTRLLNQPPNQRQVRFERTGRAPSTGTGTKQNPGIYGGYEGCAKRSQGRWMVGWGWVGGVGGVGFRWPICDFCWEVFFVWKFCLVWKCRNLELNTDMKQVLVNGFNGFNLGNLKFSCGVEMISFCYNFWCQNKPMWQSKNIYPARLQKTPLEA